MLTESKLKIKASRSIDCGMRIAECGPQIRSLLQLFLAHSKINEEDSKLEARIPHSAIRNQL